MLHRPQTPICRLQNMYKPSPIFPKIYENCRQLLIEIIAKYIMTPKVLPKLTWFDLKLQTGSGSSNAAGLRAVCNYNTICPVTPVCYLSDSE